MRPSPALFAVVFAAELLAAPAWALETPCTVAGLPDSLTTLNARLSKATQADARLAIAREAAAQAEAGPVAARACAHYLAGSAHFFMSPNKATRAHHASLAVRHLVSAQGLAPERMKDRQPRARLSTAWARVGAAGGWLSSNKLVQLDVPAGTDDLQLQAPANAWDGLCGDAPDCARNTFELGSGPDRAVTIRPGQYLVTRKSACGLTKHQVELVGGLIALPRDPPCPVALSLKDGPLGVTTYTLVGPDGAELKSAKQGQTVTIKAPGYKAKRVALPEADRHQVDLERCEATLKVDVEPAADVQGDGPGDWGPRDIVVTREGYSPVRRSVDVPPSACETPHRITLRLQRPVSVAAYGPDGQSLTLSRLQIAAEDVSVAGFSRPPGTFLYRAAHPDYGVSEGTLKVSHCDGACPPAALEIRYGERPEKAKGKGNGPLITMGVGAALLVGGAVAGFGALSADQELDDYRNKAQDGALDDLIAERDSLAETADAFFVTGGVTLAAGLIWHWVRD